MSGTIQMSRERFEKEYVEVWDALRDAWKVIEDLRKENASLRAEVKEEEGCCGGTRRGAGGAASAYNKDTKNMNNEAIEKARYIYRKDQEEAFTRYKKVKEMLLDNLQGSATPGDWENFQKAKGQAQLQLRLAADEAQMRYEHAIVKAALDKSKDLYITTAKQVDDVIAAGGDVFLDVNKDGWHMSRSVQVSMARICDGVDYVIDKETGRGYPLIDPFYCYRMDQTV